MRGKVFAIAFAGFAQRDHPRLCGEKYVLIGCSGCVLGSPPPMRGKERHADAGDIKDGITPAYAGKR